MRTPAGRADGGKYDWRVSEVRVFRWRQLIRGKGRAADVIVVTECDDLEPVKKAQGGARQGLEPRTSPGEPHEQ